MCQVCCIGSCKAVKSYDLIVNPCIDIVQIKCNGNLVNLLRISYNNVDPILGTGKDHVCINLRNYLNGSVCTCSLNVNFSDNGSIVTRLVADSEFDGMHTVGKCSGLN